MPEFLQGLYDFGPIWIGIIAVVAFFGLIALIRKLLFGK